MASRQTTHAFHVLCIASVFASSTGCLYAFNPSNALYVGFAYGNTNNNTTSKSNRVRCVR
jgi:hypothetical protein